MRVLVTGSRDWDDPAAVAKALDDAFDEMTVNSADTEFVVVHGACPTGADQHASEWVQAMNDGDFGWIVSEERHPADWSRGRGAGPERNLRMVQTGVDLCLAFIGPCTSPRCGRVDRNHPSHGATGCANLAAATGVPTRRHPAAPTHEPAPDPGTVSEGASDE
jgi:hypothetical protein